MSETFETLHNLVHKGVKVVMDIPYELWNETSAEVADLKKQVRPLGPQRLPCSPGRLGTGSMAEEGHRERGERGALVKSSHLAGFSFLRGITATCLSCSGL